LRFADLKIFNFKKYKFQGAGKPQRSWNWKSWSSRELDFIGAGMELELFDRKLELWYNKMG